MTHIWMGLAKNDAFIDLIIFFLYLILLHYNNEGLTFFLIDAESGNVTSKVEMQPSI